MSEAPTPETERRDHRRYDVALDLELEVVPEGEIGGRSRGTTINISRSGLLADVGIRPAPQTPCRVTFLDAGARVIPDTVSGYVVHAGVWRHGREAVAVKFFAPLEHLAPIEDA